VSDTVLINGNIIVQKQHYVSSIQSVMVVSFSWYVFENVDYAFRGLQHQRQELLHFTFEYLKCIS